MLIPSIKEIFHSVVAVLKRFPLAVLAIYGVTVLAVVSNHLDFGSAWQEILFNYLMTGIFAFPFMMALDLFCESKKMRIANHWILRLAGIVILGLLHFYVFSHLFNSETKYVYTALFFNAAAWSFFGFSAFVTKGRQNAFWQFVVGVLIRILLAIILFGIFYLGVIALISSIDYLFEVTINEKYYFDVWLVLTGMMATVFVMSWIPFDVQKLERSNNYPKFLRIFNEYLLVPLTSLYLLVLYAYCVKILVVVTWPKGGVGLWIIGFSTVGVITYFLAHSVKEKFFHYVEFYKKWFFVAILPLLAVLFLAIGIRINAYGITVDRYLVVMFGLWLLFLAVYFLASKAKSLKFIPVTLFVFLLFASYGPQSAFDVANWSQKERLESLLNQYGVLKDGKIVDGFSKDSATKIPNEDAAQIYSIVYYLADYNDVKFFQQWFTEDLEAAIRAEVLCNEAIDDCRIFSWNISDYVFSTLGLNDSGMYLYDDYIAEPLPDSGNYSDAAMNSYIYFRREKACANGGVNGDGFCAMEVSGFDYYINTYLYGDEKLIVHADRSYTLSLSGDKQQSLSMMDGKMIVFNIDLAVISDGLMQDYGNKSFRNVPGDKLTIVFPNGQFNIQDIAARYDKDDKLINFDSLSGELLLKK